MRKEVDSDTFRFFFTFQKCGGIEAFLLSVYNLVRIIQLCFKWAVLKRKTSGIVKAINQSINQLINQAINQPTNNSVSQSFNESINQ